MFASDYPVLSMERCLGEAGKPCRQERIGAQADRGLVRNDAVECTAERTTMQRQRIVEALLRLGRCKDLGREQCRRFLIPYEQQISRRLETLMMDEGAEGLAFDSIVAFGESAKADLADPLQIAAPIPGLIAAGVGLSDAVLGPLLLTLAYAIALLVIARVLMARRVGVTRHPRSSDSAHGGDA